MQRDPTVHFRSMLLLHSQRNQRLLRPGPAGSQEKIAFNSGDAANRLRLLQHKAIAKIAAITKGAKMEKADRLGFQLLAILAVMAIVQDLMIGGS